MKKFLCLFLCSVCSALAEVELIEKRGSTDLASVRVMQLRRDDGSRIRYPDALPSLLELMNEQARVGFDPDPLFIDSLIDERLFENPILYINCDEIPNFDFSVEENEALRRYLQLGGFLYLDAGIKASFLGSDMGHSYAAWEEREEVKDWFALIFLTIFFLLCLGTMKFFVLSTRACPIMNICVWRRIKKRLPDTVLTFVEQEKWPQGTYSFVGMKVNGCLSLCGISYLCHGLGKR